MAKVVTGPLIANPVETVRQIINWTPTTGGGWLGHNTDDNAEDYWREAAKTPGGLTSLRYGQRRQLIDDLLSGWTRGDNEVAILDILTHASKADARRLIKHFSWKSLHSSIDDGFGEWFAEAFPMEKFL